MIEIWQECSNFQTTSLRLADQVRTMIEKSWFSDFEIIEIHQKINDLKGNNTVPDTTNINKQKTLNRNEPPTSENENPTQPNNPEQKLSQEQKSNLEHLKRIMNCENTTLLSLWNIEWRTGKVETNKGNQVLTYISTNNITELNELIYARLKLVFEKIGISADSTKEKSKPGWDFRLEKQIKNLRKQAKMIKQRKDAEICMNRNEKATQEKITIHLEEINQKVLAKEGQKRTFETTKENFYQQLGGDDTKTYQ